MATKNSKAPAKSNVAKSNTIKKDAKFDLRILAVLGILLVAIVGYLFIRFSKASGPDVYDGTNLDIAFGTATKQTNGETYVYSRALDAQSAPNQPEKYGQEVMEVMAYNKTAMAVTACATGTAPAGTKASVLSQSLKNGGSTGGSTLAVNPVAQGAFSICQSFNAESMTNNNFRQFFIRFEAPVGQKIVLKRITVSPTNMTVFTPGDFSVTQTGGYAPIKTLSDGRVAVYKKLSTVQSENYGLVFSDKTTKAAGRYCFEYQISKTMNIAVNYAVVETIPSPNQVSSSVLSVAFPATATGTYGTACTSNVTVVSTTNKPYRSVALGDASPATIGELWVTKAWFEEITIAPGTSTPTPTTPIPPSLPPTTNTPVVTTPPTTSTSTSTDPVPQNATKVKQ